jgi:hypothetical protein
MKKRSKQTANNTLRKSRQLGVIGIILAIVVLAVGAMAAVSMRANKAQAGKADSSMTDQSKQTHLATMNGQVVEVNNQTGAVRPLTPEEQQQIANGMRNMLSQSDEGLKQVQRPDGSVSMNLEGRFQNVSVAQKNEDGSISQSCVNSPETAGAFFGIEAEKFGAKTKSDKSAGKPVGRSVPGKGEVK